PVHRRDRVAWLFELRLQRLHDSRRDRVETASAKQRDAKQRDKVVASHVLVLAGRLPTHLRGDIRHEYADVLAKGEDVTSVAITFERPRAKTPSTSRPRPPVRLHRRSRGTARCRLRPEGTRNNTRSTHR